MMPPPGAPDNKEIKTLQKDKEDLTKLVQELMKQLASKEQPRAESSRQT